jgi:hypothetical protein
MSDTVTIEVIGFSESPCGPFRCDENRTCGLEACAPGERLVDAFEALKSVLADRYGDSVSCTLTLLDDGVPERIIKIVEEHQPPVPIVLVNGRITPLGRISLPLIERELEKYIA